MLLIASSRKETSYLSITIGSTHTLYPCTRCILIGALLLNQVKVEFVKCIMRIWFWFLYSKIVVLFVYLEPILLDSIFHCMNLFMIEASFKFMNETLSVEGKLLGDGTTNYYWVVLHKLLRPILSLHVFEKQLQEINFRICCCYQ